MGAVEQRGLPKRYEGRRDVGYVLRGRSIAETQRIAGEILGGIAEGKSLRSLLRKEGMPSMPTFFTWLRADRDFHALYARAREAQAESMADEITDIADAAQGADSAGVNAARLRVDARKWVAAKLLPRKYGDHVNIEHSGGISVAAVSKALRTVQPVTFDEEGNEVQDAELVGTQDANSTQHAHDATGTMIAEVSDHFGEEHANVVIGTGSARSDQRDPPPPGGSPAQGTPITVTTPVSSQQQIPKIPAQNVQSLSESRHPALSDLL